MFRFLKKFLKEEQIEESIKSENLKDWIKTKNVLTLKKIEENLSEIDIPLLLNELQEKLENLKTAKLRNENIPPKVKHVMESHRNNYIKRVTKFIKEAKEEAENSEKLELAEYFEREMLNLSKETIKSFTILNEFFADNCKKIGITLNKISDLQKKVIYLRKKEKINEIMNLTNQITELSHLFEEQKNQKQTEKKDSNQKKEFLTELKIKKVALKKIIDGKEIKEIKDKITEKEVLEQKIKNHEHEFINIFAEIERALRKYQKISLNPEIILEYLDSPIQSLIKDNENKILTELEKLKNQVIKGSVDLKDKKKEKTIQALEKINKELLNQVREQISETQNKLDSLKEEISKVNILNEKTEIESQITDLEKNLNNLTQTLEKTDYEASIKEKINQIQEYSLEKINIKLQVLQ